MTDLKQKILAIIPARKGSKRIENKNILDLNGKPMIAYTIEAAKNSGLIDKLIVSTNCKQTAEISKTYSAEIPFMRPEELATDDATTFRVIDHAISYFREADYEFDIVVLLQPTSPLRNSKDINEAIGLIDHNTEAVVSVCKAEHSPLWCNTLPPDRSMENFLNKELSGKRSQELPEYYRLNGAIYVAKRDYLLKNKGFFGQRTKAYIMPQSRSVDIDSIDDLGYAEYLICRSHKTH